MHFLGLRYCVFSIQFQEEYITLFCYLILLVMCHRNSLSCLVFSDDYIVHGQLHVSDWDLQKAAHEKSFASPVSEILPLEKLTCLPQHVGETFS